MKQISPEMKRSYIASLLLGISLLCLNTASAQNPSIKVFEEWHTSGGYQTMYQKNRVYKDASGYSYVAGATYNNQGNYDMMLAVYKPTGQLDWMQTYNGAGNGDDAAADVKIDSNGDIYLIGSYYENVTDSNNAIVIKYDASGSQQWVSTYNGSGSGSDGFARLEIDGTDIYAVGITYSGTSQLYDFLVMKLDNSGNQTWVNTWDNAGMVDAAISVGYSGTDLTVAGGSQVTATKYAYAIATFDMGSGSLNSATTSGGSSLVAYDQVTDLYIASNGDIYITGGVQNTGVGYDMRTIKLDPATLNILWTATYNGSSSLDDMGNSISADANGDIYVTGYETVSGQGKNYVTIKYANSNGSTQWTKIYNDASNGADEATAIAVQGTSRVYVSGSAFNGSNTDYQTFCYDASNGNEIWSISYNGLLNKNDRAADLAIIANGQIVVTGSEGLQSGLHYTTVKYIEKTTTSPQDPNTTTSSSFVYTENKGQLLNTDRLQIPEVRYSVVRSSPKVYFSDTAVFYAFSKIDTSSQHQDSLTRVDMKFKNANTDLRIRALGDPRKEISNYYLPRRGGAIEHILNYDQLVSFNVWNNVDMIYGSNLRGMKYYFICKPGGGGSSYTNIDLLYEGADTITVNGNGDLVIHTVLGDIVQPKAGAWQLDASGNYLALNWQPTYNLIGNNEVKFSNIGAYNTSLPLIFAVDWGNLTPASTTNLDWSTYIGEDDRDLLSDIAINDADGSTHYLGESLSTYFPTVFEIQTQNGGGWNAVAIKADSLGHLVYSTFYGADTALSSGSAVVVRNASDLDANGNYFIGGRATYNSIQHIQFPTVQPSGAYVDTTIANTTYGDAFFAAFNPVGQLIWATYFGGTGYATEIINDLEFDNNGNLYFVMDADSLTPHVPLAGAYNDPSNQKGGFVGKFDSNLNYVWGTSFGTPVSNNQTTARLTIDNAGTVYVTGKTENGLPTVNPGGGAYYDPTWNGPFLDAYIARFNPADSLTWCTYFGGTQYEEGWGMTTFNKDLYLTGFTLSNDFPLMYSGNEYIDSINNGNDDAFICRFSSTGILKWSSYYGGSGIEYVPTDVTHDQAGNIYVMGGTASTNFPTFDPGIIYTDQTFNGSYEHYIFAFDPFNELAWATYFGGSDHEATDLGIAAWGTDKLYVCGSTATTSLASVPFPLQNLGGGAYWQPTLFGNVSYDAYISRFSIDSLVIWIGMDEQVSTSQFGSLSIYPNPSNGEFQVSIHSEGSNKEIQVYNSIGQIIETVRLNDNLSDQRILLNLSSEATGIYFVVLKQDSGLLSTKIIKQ